jgi:hypothetical protein
VIFENRPRPPGRLESCWPTDFREFVTQGLARANQPMVVESWCDVPPETARCRFEARHPRHPVHGDLPTDDEWARWSHTARPLRIGPTLHVDTTGPVDVGAVTARIRAKHPGLTHNQRDQRSDDPIHSVEARNGGAKESSVGAVSKISTDKIRLHHSAGRHPL